MHSKIPRLQTLYDRFENQARPYKAEAACRKGCAFCCTDAGAIHITTLEGLARAAVACRMARPSKVVM